MTAHTSHKNPILGISLLNQQKHGDSKSQDLTHAVIIVASNPSQAKNVSLVWDSAGPPSAGGPRMLHEKIVSYLYEALLGLADAAHAAPVDHADPSPAAAGWGLDDPDRPRLRLHRLEPRSSVDTPHRKARATQLHTEKNTRVQEQTLDGTHVLIRAGTPCDR